MDLEEDYVELHRVVADNRTATGRYDLIINQINTLWEELAVGSSVKAFDRFFRHLIRLRQDRLQLDTLGATASQAVGQRAVNLTVSPRIFLNCLPSLPSIQLSPRIFKFMLSLSLLEAEAAIDLLPLLRPNDALLAFFSSARNPSKVSASFNLASVPSSSLKPPSYPARLNLSNPLLE
jgi:hypothetical protein